MWITWTVLGILITFARGLLNSRDASYSSYAQPKLKYENYSFMALLPNPDLVKDPSAAAWNSSGSVTDFDNAIPTYEYTNSSGDLASSASLGAPSYAHGWGPEARQYEGDYSKAYMPLITYFDVKCDKRGMHVHVEFNKPFNGIIFSKGFFNTPDCRYVPAKSYGKTFDFTVTIDYCGTSGEDHSYDYKDSYYENTIIIQFDEYIQEVWDLAKTIRCEWNAYYDKSVAVRPYNVGNLDPVLYRFNGDNIESWIQVQKGKGPWAEEVYGIVKVGDPLTLVIGIRDTDGKFDMQVKDCFATDGYGGRVQLTDYYGCVVRDKIMSPFRKVKDYGPQATVVSYAYFQAFKFPDRYEVGIKCNIQVCLGKCQGGCPGDYGSGGGGYQKSGTNYQSEPGYPAPTDYDKGSAAPGGAYSNVDPSQKIDLSQFGPGPYVPDVPRPPSPPVAPYLGAYDTNHVIGVDTSVATGDAVNAAAPNMFGPTNTKKSSANTPTLDPYRKKRDLNNSTEESSNTTTTTQMTTVETTVSTSTTTTLTTRFDLPSKSARIPKVINDDGQINLDGKFKVIAPHDIQSDNINAGPQEVSVAATNAICIAVSSFTAGVTLLVAVLILSILVTFFVCFRLRKLSQKLNGTTNISPVRTRKTNRATDVVQSTMCWTPPIRAARAPC